jgi:hypothetical protein
MPSVGALAAWMEQLDASGENLAEVVEVGRTLGLIGCNAALDRRLASTLARATGDERIRAIVAALAEEPAYRALVADIAVALVRSVPDEPERFAHVRQLSRQRAFMDAVYDHAAGSPEFAVRAVWERLAVERAPAHRPRALAALAPLASSEGEQYTVRLLFGAHGPRTAEEHVELLHAYADRRVPDVDLERAYELLVHTPLADYASVEPLAVALSASPGIQDSSGYTAWYVARHGQDTDIEPWSRYLQTAMRARPTLPAERTADLLALAASRAARSAGASLHGFARAEEAFGDTFGRHWTPAFGDALARRIGHHAQPAELIARIYSEWADVAPRLIETVLPQALRNCSGSQLAAVGARLESHPKLRERWDSWVERHPPQSGLGRTVGRLFKRGDA